MRVAYSCHTKWQLFDLKEDLTGSVIAYNKGFCHLGNSKVATSAIVLTGLGDTIRVLEFCAKAELHKGDKVIINKSTAVPINDRSALNFDFDCTIVKTCYAHLKKINEQ